MCILQIHAGKAKYPFYSDLGSSEAPATLLLIACYITIETNDPAQTLLMVLSFFPFVPPISGFPCCVTAEALLNLHQKCKMPAYFVMANTGSITLVRK